MTVAAEPTAPTPDGAGRLVSVAPAACAAIVGRVSAAAPASVADGTASPGDP
jgi:hypothetical protein